MNSTKQRPFAIALAASLALASATDVAMAQLRVVNYNTTSGPRAGMDNILASIGLETVNGVAKPIDVLTLQEQSSSATTTQSIVNVLNGIYGAGTYARATLDGGTTGGGRPGLIYNTQTVQLIGQTTASTTSSSGAARQTLRYQIRPVGYGSSADFYVYSSHYKASDSSSDRNRRNVEAQQVRANADALGQGAHLIYAGDFNVYFSNEPMYQTLLSAGNGQAFDPINRPGNWHDNSTFIDVHTQNPAGSGFVGGGMDDRFDFQLVSGEMLDNEGLSYISGSYRAFGNTGTHQFNGAINSGSATALQSRLPGYSQAQAQAVLDNLSTQSDHLPVVADYQLPAAMGVQVGSSPALVIKGAAVSLDVEVSNVANVVATIGADELDYTVSGNGSLSGSVNGTDQALGTGNLHALQLNTASTGNQSGNVVVTSTSQSAANPNFSQAVQYTVLEHSNASFNGVDDLNSLVLDFGAFAPGSGMQTLPFNLFNLETVDSFTAGLDLDLIQSSGDLTQLSADLTTFSNLSADQGIGFSAYFDAVSPGLFSTTYTLSLSDQDLPGAQSGQTLTLILQGHVVPEPAAAALLLPLVMLMRRRRG